MSLPAPIGTQITINIDASHPGAAIPANFEGLSFETKILTDSPDILNENDKTLIQLLKNLGAGVLRVGGDTSDEIFWTGQPRTSTTGPDSLTTTDVDRLSAFSRACGWPVWYGLNMGYFQPDVAANETQYVANSLKGNLYMVEFGNEPDVYHLFGLRNKTYGFIDFQADWEAYLKSVSEKVPSATFSGPGNAYNTDFPAGFAAVENKNVKFFDAHYYTTGPASDSSITYHNLLNQDWKLPSYLYSISNASVQYNIPYRITECNNIYGGGRAGVSDTFTAALWALNFMWTIAESNGSGINFHGGNGLFYSPIAVDKGVITAKPEYYAMLAFKYGGVGGAVIPVQLSQTTYNCTAYATVNTDQSNSFTLINKEEKTDFAFKIEMGKTVSEVDLMNLTAPTILSKTGTTFAGTTVSTDGSFAPKPLRYATNNKSSFFINVPAGSAVVITVKQ